MRFRHVLLAVIALATLKATSPSAQVQPADLLQRWVASVLSHQPGVADDAVREIWALRAEDISHIEGTLSKLLEAMMGPMPSPSGSQELVIIDRLGASAALQISPLKFLERAAVLHADAAIFDPRPTQALLESAVPKDVRRARSPWGTTDDARLHSSFTTTRDGEATGSVASNPNWSFARFALRRIPKGEAPEFLGLWYHAVAAYLFSTGAFGELDWHLEDETNLLPADARLLFDRGALAEVFSMNLMQEAADDAISRSRTPGALAMSGRTIASPAKGQDIAAAYYERAIQADPRFAEAHVRLARLLDLKGRDAESLDHIRLAIDSAPETAVLFYAHLFAARSSETLGQVSDADAHARSALDLFPEAQSALLAASQTALHKGDVERAQLLFGQLADQEDPLSSDRDPWIIYPYGPGRNVQTLLAQLWHATPTVH